MFCGPSGAAAATTAEELPEADEENEELVEGMTDKDFMGGGAGGDGEDDYPIFRMSSDGDGGEQSTMTGGATE